MQAARDRRGLRAGNTGEAGLPQVLLVGLGWPVPTFIARRVAVLADLGVPVVVACDRRAAKDVLPKGVRVVREMSRARGLLALACRSATRPGQVAALLREIPGTGREKLYFLSRHPYLVSISKPNLIHQQWIGSAQTWATVARALGVPLVASARGSQVTLEPHDARKRLTIQRCLAAADAVHCVSDSILERCAVLGAEREKLFVNYGGIDTERFATLAGRMNRTSDADTLRLVTVGSLIARKNVAAQLLVLRSLRDAGVSANLTVVGGGPDELALKQMASCLGVGEAVEFAGAQPDDAVIRHLQAADVCLSTSVAEGLANSILEAASCGLPVVVFDCEGMREVIQDGSTGFVVPFGDLAGMVDRLTILAKDSAARLALGAAGREWVRARFEARRCAQEMIEHYRRIVSRRKW